MGISPEGEVPAKCQYELRPLPLPAPETTAYGRAPRPRSDHGPVRLGLATSHVTTTHQRRIPGRDEHEGTGLGFSDLAGSRRLRHLAGPRLAGHGRYKKCRWPTHGRREPDQFRLVHNTYACDCVNLVGLPSLSASIYQVNRRGELQTPGIFLEPFFLP
jgi:hypothetical protein